MSVCRLGIKAILIQYFYRILTTIMGHLLRVCISITRAR